MDYEQLRRLESDFRELCVRTHFKSAFGFFVDTKNEASMIYRGISDNEIMHLLFNVIKGLAEKRGISPDVILGKLKDGFDENTDS